MKTFDSLTEQEILALAIALEEDARIYEELDACPDLRCRGSCLPSCSFCPPGRSF